jgi:hypothetical protein
MVLFGTGSPAATLSTINIHTTSVLSLPSRRMLHVVSTSCFQLCCYQRDRESNVCGNFDSARSLTWSAHVFLSRTPPLASMRRWFNSRTGTFFPFLPWSIVFIQRLLTCRTRSTDMSDNLTQGRGCKFAVLRLWSNATIPESQRSLLHSNIALNYMWCNLCNWLYSPSNGRTCYFQPHILCRPISISIISIGRRYKELNINWMRFYSL